MSYQEDDRHQGWDGQRHQHHQQQQQHPIRLPRLQIMDDDMRSASSSSSAAMAHRHRSASGGSQSGMAAFAPWSPGSDHPSIASGGSQSQISSPSTSLPPHHGPSRSHPLSASASTSPKIPMLPTPHRRSTMLEGSLPPLAATMAASASLGSSASRIRSSSGSAAHLFSRSPILPSYGPLSQSGPGPASSSMPYSPSASSSSIASQGMPAPPSGMPAPPPPSGPAMSPPTERKPAKAHVSSACLNCKRAHLACDAERPCRRCTKLGKTATCVDVQHKKRGRPRLKDREMAPSVQDPAAAAAVAAAWSPPRGAVEGGPMPSSSSYYGQPHQWGPAGGPSEMAMAHDARARSYSTASAAPPSGYHSMPSPPSASASSYRSPPASYAHPQAHAHPAAPHPPPVATLLCGTDLVAAHVSQESQAIFGLPPAQLRHRSAVELVHPSDHPRFEEAWNRLVRPVDIGPLEFPALGEEIMRSEPCRLLEPARGTIFVDETVRMRVVGNAWAPCSVRFYLGGAFGLDLYRPETKDRAFIVCSIYPLSANDLAQPSSAGSSSAAATRHPDLEVLRSTEYPPTSHWTSASFESPATRTSPYMSQRTATYPSPPEQQREPQRGWEEASSASLARRSSVKRSLPAEFANDEQGSSTRRPSFANTSYGSRPRLSHLNTSPGSMRPPTSGSYHTLSPIEQPAASMPAARPTAGATNGGRPTSSELRHPFSSFPSSSSVSFTYGSQPHRSAHPTGSSSSGGGGSSNNGSSPGAASLRHPPLSNARGLVSHSKSLGGASSLPLSSSNGARGLAAAAAAASSTKARVTAAAPAPSPTTTVAAGGGGVGAALAC